MKFSFIFIICIVLAIPIAVFEYFVLFWFWGGDGVLTFIAVPIIFIIFIGIHILLIHNYKGNKLVNTIIKFSLVLSTPILSMLVVWIIAKIFGINIGTQ